MSRQGFLIEYDLLCCISCSQLCARIMLCVCVCVCVSMTKGLGEIGEVVGQAEASQNCCNDELQPTSEYEGVKYLKLLLYFE